MTGTPVAGVLSRLRRAVTGQAGPGPAWALAATAAFAMLVSVALPRVIANAENHSVLRALAGMPSLTAGIAVSAQWHPFAGDHGTVLTPAQAGLITNGLAAAVPPPLTAPARQRWAGATAPSQIVVNPEPSTVLHGPPVAEVAYRSNLTTHARLIAGSWPGLASSPGGGAGQPGGGNGTPGGGVQRGSGGEPGAAGCPAAAGRPAILAVAATASTAARFGLRPGSLLDLCPYQAGDPAIDLRVTGVVRPVRPDSAFWQYDPVLATPQLLVQKDGGQILFAGLMLGPGELAALQTAYSSAGFQGIWFYPLDLHRLTASAISRVQSALAGLASSGLPAGVAESAQTQFTGPPVATSGLGAAIAAFTAQLKAATGVDGLFATGLDVTALFLLLVCAWLTVRAHAGELALLRARGGSTSQVARRMFGRGAVVTIPALAAATAVAIVTVPANSPAAWPSGGIAAVIALAAPAVIAAWAHRQAGAGGDRAGGAGTGAAAAAGRTGRAGRLARAGHGSSGGERRRGGRQRGMRRVVGEVFVLAVAAASLIALRRRGLASGADPFLAASPVLAALAAGVAAARVVPATLRPLLAGAGRRRGAVAFLGLAAAVRTRAVALPAALALALALTLAAFGLVVAGSVSAGQSTAAWRTVGADVVIQAPGDATVSRAAQTAIGRVAGVRHTAAVYVAGVHSPLAATLGTQPVGLVVVSPASYAALSEDTPWPGFPAALLTGPRRAGARGPGTSGAGTSGASGAGVSGTGVSGAGVGGGPVPVLASPGLALPGAAASGTPSAGAASAGAVSAGSAGGRLAARGLGRATVVLDGATLPVVIAGRLGASPAMPSGGPYLVLPSWAAPRLPSLPGPQTLLVTGGGIDLGGLHAAVARYLPGSRVTVRRQVLAGLTGAPAAAASAQVYTIGIWASAALAAVAVLFALLASARSRAQLLARLAALGMARRDSWALALTGAVPLLGVAVLAMVTAVLLLSATTGPALGLAVFSGAGAGSAAVLAGSSATLTAAAAPAPLHLSPAALVIPAALVGLLAVLILAGELVLTARRTAAAAVRHENPAAVGVEED